MMKLAHALFLVLWLTAQTCATKSTNGGDTFTSSTKNIKQIPKDKGAEEPSVAEMVAQIHEDLLNEQIQKHRETAGKTKFRALSGIKSTDGGQRFEHKLTKSTDEGSTFEIDATHPQIPNQPGLKLNYGKGTVPLPWSTDQGHSFWVSADHFYTVNEIEEIVQNNNKLIQKYNKTETFSSSALTEELIAVITKAEKVAKAAKGALVACQDAHAGYLHHHDWVHHHRCPEPDSVEWKKFENAHEQWHATLKGLASLRGRVRAKQEL